MQAFEQQLREAGYLAMGGQIVDARWTIKIGGKIRYRHDGTPLPQIATPASATTSAADSVWADSAYRSQKNEAWLTRNMLKSRIHRRKPKG